MEVAKVTEMRVAVVGGTGTLGAPIVERLVGRGDEVLVLSRGEATSSIPSGASHRKVDLATGAGLAAALAGVDAVIDASNSQKQAGPVLVEGTQRLLEVGDAAGVAHHLTISIVGCDRVPIAYYRAKAEQEAALEAGAVPWSLLRATQFHPLLAGLFAAAARRRLRPTGAAQIQPIDVSVVAERLADAVHAGPAGRLPDLAGPEVRTLGDLSAAWQRANGRWLLPLRVPSVGKVGRALRDGALCDPAAATPGPRFEEWLAR
jgi:uncharacterized protein YbjT (DUF2867 family)